MVEEIEEPGGPDSIRDLDAASWNPQEILGDFELAHPIPLRALGLSFMALFVPILTAVFFPEFSSGDTGLLIWLTALVPAFLLTYYRGWPGASLALAMGMAALAITQVALLLAGIRLSNWSLLGGIVVVYIGISLGLGWLTELLHVQRRHAEKMALSDTLTGMPNRRHSVVFVEAAFAAAQRGIPLTVVLFDIDKFKVYNDTRGHPAGDQALQRVAAILLESTRRMNLSARWGGGGVPEPPLRHPTGRRGHLRRTDPGGGPPCLPRQLHPDQRRRGHLRGGHGQSGPPPGRRGPGHVHRQGSRGGLCALRLRAPPALGDRLTTGPLPRETPPPGTICPSPPSSGGPLSVPSPTTKPTGCLSSPPAWGPRR